MRRLALLLALLAPLSAFAAFKPTTEPVSPDGAKAVVDLPRSQHMRNTGGSDGPRGPGSGSGLCVFTSIEHSARWQNVATLDGFQKWMTKKPGGGYPQKVDAMLKQFCAERGVPVPPYVQHTGGDDEFLTLALRTDRMPCVTYAGRDDFYGGLIYHMVNLAHLDASRAAIIDNNRPGYWVWMSRAEFLSRWRDADGGWAVVLLSDPPPPHPEAAQVAAPCICGDDCKCAAGTCPNKCPVFAGGCDCCKPSCTCAPGKTDKDCDCYPCKCNRPVVRGQDCAGGRWGAPRVGPVGPAIPAPIMLPKTQPAAGPEPIGNPPSDRHEWRAFDDGSYGWRLRDAAPVGAVENHGVDSTRIHSHPAYSINGKEVTREQARAAMLADDSSRWHLTAVGPMEFLSRVAADVSALPDQVRGKVLFQAYPSGHWAADAFKLPEGLSLRKPSPARAAADVGVVTPGEYSGAKLGALLAMKGGPLYVEPAPQPVPPAPQPGPVVPVPQPQPGPAMPPWWVWLVLAAVVVLIGYDLFFRRKVIQ
jgi:hypothetical protein